MRTEGTTAPARLPHRHQPPRFCAPSCATRPPRRYYKGIFDIQDFDDLDANVAGVALPTPRMHDLQTQQRQALARLGITGAQQSAAAPRASATADATAPGGVNAPGRGPAGPAAGGGADPAAATAAAAPEEPKTESGTVLYKLSSLLHEADDDLFDDDDDTGTHMGSTVNAHDQDDQLLFGGAAGAAGGGRGCGGGNVLCTGWANVTSASSAGSHGTGRKWVELSEGVGAGGDGQPPGPFAVLTCTRAPPTAAGAGTADEPFLIRLGALSLVNRRSGDSFDVYTQRGISTLTVQSKPECDKWVAAVNNAIERVTGGGGARIGAADGTPRLTALAGLRRQPGVRLPVPRASCFVVCALCFVCVCFGEGTVVAIQRWTAKALSFGALSATKVREMRSGRGQFHQSTAIVLLLLSVVVGGGT